MRFNVTTRAQFRSPDSLQRFVVGDFSKVGSQVTSTAKIKRNEMRCQNSSKTVTQLTHQKSSMNFGVPASTEKAGFVMGWTKRGVERIGKLKPSQEAQLPH